MNVQYDDFSPGEILSITDDSLFGAARILGEKTRGLAQSALKKKMDSGRSAIELSKASALYARAQAIAREAVFILDGKNILAKYLDMLAGFAEGAGLSMAEVVFLQSFGDISCQTLFVQDVKTGSVNIVHMEENENDPHLFGLNRALERAQNVQQRSVIFGNRTRMRRSYPYRIVHMITNADRYEFFAYPGIVGPGSTFGINHKTQSIVMADTLNPSNLDSDCDLWANAVAYIIADLGDARKARHFMRKFTDASYTILGGYAMHLIPMDGSSRPLFCEFSADHVIFNEPSHSNSRIAYAQTNYPRSLDLQKTDPWSQTDGQSIDTIQAGIMIKRRTRQLRDIATLRVTPGTDHIQNIKDLKRLIATPEGDIEWFENGPVLAGFSNPYVAGYFLGSFRAGEGNLLMGKLMPPPIAGSEYRLTFSPSQARNRPERNLRERTVRYLLSHKPAVSVTVLCSTPTARARASGYAESDDDTAFVAQKVADALNSIGVRAVLLPISESTIDAVGGIHTTCVCNLVEWTGLDMPLSVEVFKRLRKLNIPVTGATAKNFCSTSDKITAKRLFIQHNIPSPQSQVFVTGAEPVDPRFVYPVIIKPSQEHGSVGLTREAIAYSPHEVQSIAREQIKKHRQPALAESFIDGRELLVYLLEKNEKLTVLPVEEILFMGKESHQFQTYESKWEKDHPDYTATRVVRAKLTDYEKKTVESIAKKTFRRLGFRSYARLDIRFKDGVPYILEANANPNMYDSDDDQIPGIDFADFVWEIVANALRAYKNGWKI